MITHKSVQIVWFFQERKNNDIYLELFNDLKKKKNKNSAVYESTRYFIRPKESSNM